MTANELRELLDYDPTTGVFIWKVSTINHKRVGKIAGTVLRDSRHGYRYIIIAGKHYKGSRLAWLYITGRWPTGQIDHKNGVRDDDRFQNLRDVSAAVNQQNQRRAQRHNVTGFLGVSPVGDRFRATIRIDGKKCWLGSFDTAVEAHAAYVKAKRVHHPGGLL